MPQPEKTQTKTPAGGDQAAPKMGGLFVPPQALAVEEPAANVVPPEQIDDSKLEFAHGENEGPVKEGAEETPQTPVEFKRFNSDDEEVAASAGVSFKDMVAREKNAPATPQQKPVTTPQQTPAQKSNVEQRDYSGIDEADVPVFKKMANESFSRLKPLYVERKQLAAKVAELEQKMAQQTSVHPTLYNHPQGYLLDPEFNETSQALSLAEAATEHWQRQEINLRRGIDWQDLEYVNGQLIPTAPKAADVDAEMYVAKKLRAAQGISMQMSQKRDSYINNFNNRQKQDNEFVSGIIKEYFPGHDKPDHETAPIQKQLLNLIPESLRNVPTTPLLCIIGAHNILLQRQLAQLQNNKTVAQAVKNDAKNAPPPASAFRTGGGNGNQVSFSAMRQRG